MFHFMVWNWESSILKSTIKLYFSSRNWVGWRGLVRLFGADHACMERVKRAATIFHADSRSLCWHRVSTGIGIQLLDGCLCWVRNFLFHTDCRAGVSTHPTVVKGFLGLVLVVCHTSACPWHRCFHWVQGFFINGGFPGQLLKGSEDTNACYPIINVKKSAAYSVE